MNTIVVNGQVFDLANATSGNPTHRAETVVLYHAAAPVYVPAPGGGEYCLQAVCHHNHPDNDSMYECGERLARIIRSGRIPKWATVS